jgi:hypothetical protein
MLMQCYKYGKVKRLSRTTGRSVFQQIIISGRRSTYINNDNAIRRMFISPGVLNLANDIPLSGCFGDVVHLMDIWMVFSRRLHHLQKIGATPNKSNKCINFIHNHNIYHPHIPHLNIPDRLLQKQKLS